MITYVLIGGMKGTTWVQIIKALLLIAGTAVITSDGARQVQLQLLRRFPVRPPTTPPRATSCSSPA